MAGVDVGNPAAVAAGNRASAAATPDLSPMLDALQQVAPSFPPQDQEKLAQAAALIQSCGAGAGAAVGAR